MPHWPRSQLQTMFTRATQSERSEPEIMTEPVSATLTDILACPTLNTKYCVQHPIQSLLMHTAVTVLADAPLFTAAVSQLDCELLWAPKKERVACRPVQLRQTPWASTHHKPPALPYPPLKIRQPLSAWLLHGPTTKFQYCSRPSSSGSQQVRRSPHKIRP